MIALILAAALDTPPGFYPQEKVKVLVIGPVEKDHTLLFASFNLSGAAFDQFTTGYVLDRRPDLREISWWEQTPDQRSAVNLASVGLFTWASRFAEKRGWTGLAWGITIGHFVVRVFRGIKNLGFASERSSAK